MNDDKSVTKQLYKKFLEQREALKKIYHPVFDEYEQKRLQFNENQNERNKKYKEVQGEAFLEKKREINREAYARRKARENEAKKANSELLNQMIQNNNSMKGKRGRKPKVVQSQTTDKPKGNLSEKPFEKDETTDETTDECESISESIVPIVRKKKFYV